LCGAEAGLILPAMVEVPGAGSTQEAMATWARRGDHAYPPVPRQALEPGALLSDTEIMGTCPDESVVCCRGVAPAVCPDASSPRVRTGPHAR
jgi:hypothetical protein